MTTNPPEWLCLALGSAIGFAALPLSAIIMHCLLYPISKRLRWDEVQHAYLVGLAAFSPPMLLVALFIRWWRVNGLSL